MQLLPGFGGGSAPAPVAPAPAPTREDPAIAQAKDALRQSELRKRGRSGSILTSGSGLEDSFGNGTTIQRPRASSGGLDFGPGAAIRKLFGG